MKISYAEYIKKTDVSVLIAEAIFSELEKKTTIKTIEDVANTSSGGTPLRSNFEYYGGEIPWLKSGELNDGIIENAVEFITEKGLVNSSAKLLPENTLLLAMYGATAGRTGITKIKASTNQAVCALFPKDEISQEYLFWFLRQHRYKFIEISKGGAQPNISQTVIGNTKIPIPNKKLQKQITDVLNKIENEGILDISIIPIEFQAKVKSVFATKNNVFGIDTELSYQLDLVKKLRQQLLQDAVQGKLVEQNSNDQPASELLKKIKDEKVKLIAEKKLKKEKELPPIKPEEIPFEIPDNWIWCRLGEIAEIGTGGTPLTSNSDYYENGNIPWITSSATNNLFVLEPELYITEKALKETNCKVYPTGTLVVAMYGQGKTRGQITELNFPAATNQACATITLFFNEFTFRKYVKLFFQKIYNEIRELAQGGAQPNLNMGKIRDTIIPIPPLLEQHRIVQKLDELMQYCNDLEASIKQSQQQNEKLLQQVLREALRGESIVN